MYLFPVYYLKKDLKKFITNSDIIVSILPSTHNTKYFINKIFLNLMKKNALLISVGRGSILNEKDLISHIKNNENFFASLDVFEKEPLMKSSPLWQMKNVIITPHTAFFSKASSEELQRRTCEEVIRVINNEKPENFINPEVRKNSRSKIN